MKTERHYLHKTNAKYKYCRQCYTVSKVNRLLADAPHFEPLRVHLISQIDNGAFSHAQFRTGRYMHQALCALRKMSEVSHEWVDRLSVPNRRREIIRGQLIECGLLTQRMPSTKGTKLALLQPVDLRSCSHRKVVCNLCRAVRSLQAAFEPYPRYAALRDWYIAQLISGTFPLSYFRGYNNRLWALIRELGEHDGSIQEWLDTKIPVVALRLFRVALIGSALLEAKDHDQVVRFRSWFPRFLRATGLEESDRNTIERYCRLSMMRLARQRCFRASNQGLLIGKELRTHVRRVVDLTRHLNEKRCSLKAFSADDVLDFPLPQPSRIRHFLFWLRRNGLTEASWIPHARQMSREYRGMGIAGLRIALDALIEDSTISLELRVAGLLTYFGFRSTALVKLRTSHVLADGSLQIGPKTFPLEPEVAHLVLGLKEHRSRESLGSHNAQWDPWLFASAQTVEMPQATSLARRLLRIGFSTKLAHNEGVRVGSALPLAHYVAQRAVGRASGTPATHLRVFSVKAGDYASMIVKERLRADQEF